MSRRPLPRVLAHRCSRCGAGTEVTTKQWARLCTMCGGRLRGELHTYVRAKKKGAGIKLVPIASLTKQRFRQGGPAQAKRARRAKINEAIIQDGLIGKLTVAVAKKRHGWHGITRSLSRASELDDAVAAVVRLDMDRKLKAARADVATLLTEAGYHDPNNEGRRTIVKRLLKQVRKEP